MASITTTIYRVDNPKLLREVKVGDQIMGKVIRVKRRYIMWKSSR